MTALVTFVTTASRSTVVVADESFAGESTKSLFLAGEDISEGKNGGERSLKGILEPALEARPFLVVAIF